MNGPDHYRAAEGLLELVETEPEGSRLTPEYLAAAQAHATLALAAAAAYPAVKDYCGDEDGSVSPATEILRFDSGVYQASCSCGWYRESPGVHTRKANQEALDFHLTYEHGLVTS
jgi:hypothetical protein